MNNTKQECTIINEKINGSTVYLAEFGEGKVIRKDEINISNGNDITGTGISYEVELTNGNIIHLLYVNRMDIKTYQTIIEKTAIYPKEIGLMYCALGLNGEAGEIAEKVKKLYRDTDYLNNNIMSEEVKSSIKTEISDCLWYCTALANELGASLEEILEINYNKLMKRRETNTIHGSGDNRENN